MNPSEDDMKAMRQQFAAQQLETQGMQLAVIEQMWLELARVLAERATATQQPPYYDIVLSLFGMGWADRRYRFTRTGELAPRWASECKASTS